MLGVASLFRRICARECSRGNEMPDRGSYRSGAGGGKPRDPAFNVHQPLDADHFRMIGWKQR